MSEHEPCPFCGSETIAMLGGGEWKATARCDECAAEGPTGTTREDAWSGWQRTSDVKPDPKRCDERKKNKSNKRRELWSRRPGPRQVSTSKFAKKLTHKAERRLARAELRFLLDEVT